MDPEVRRRLVQELPQIYERALVRILAMTRGDVKSAEELLNDAVLRTLEGERTWDPARVPDLDYFLAEAARSIRSAEAEHAEVAARHRVAGTVDARSNDALIAREQVNNDMKLVFECADGDPDLARVVEVMMDGQTKAAEIAELTKMDVKRVYSLLQKLRRRLAARRKERNP